MDRNQVAWVYRTFLRREPENDDVIDMQAKQHETRADLILTIMSSEEFQLKDQH